MRGATVVARNAVAFSRRAQFARLALVNGNVGIVGAPNGRLFTVLTFAISRGRIAEIDVVADPERLRQLELGVVSD
jgi:RNA polymerase sigma-70 factor (ECF subfamily)